LQRLGLCRPGRPNPPATLLVTTASNSDDESYTSLISWFEQMFFVPPALIVLHNATVNQLRYQVVLFWLWLWRQIWNQITAHTKALWHWHVWVVRCWACCLMCFGVTGKNVAFVNSWKMSGCPTEVYLVDVWNWLISWSGILDKLLVFKLVKNFPAFFFLEAEVPLPQGWGAQIQSK